MVFMSVQEFRDAMSLQGVPIEEVTFECPRCKTKQSANDLIAAGAGKNFDEVQKYLKEETQQRHQMMFDDNMRVLKNKFFGYYEFKSTVCLFREKGKPKVDFYPHTGRWKVGTKMYRGGAESFLAWYTKQR